ncbi:MAG TPA: 2-oxoacid:acceptor oxidoreductase subunit alpha [Propionibacteriaceae bacterium]
MTEVRTLDHAVIRFAGDSGDGMQLTGDRFTAETATFGNDIATLPNFPAEIRAPAGTLPGVSSFQLHFANSDIATPGDHPEVLVAMNPAALKVNLPDVRLGGMVIVDTADFTERNLARIGYATNPLTDGTLDAYQLVALDLTGLAVAAVKAFGLGRKDAARTKNMFALGLLTWLYGRPVEGTEQFLGRRFAARPDIRDSNLAAFRAGHAYGETTETFAVRYEVPPAPMPAGEYRQINGNTAAAYGLMVAARKAGMPLFLGSYPITPASDILHELSKHKLQGVMTFQAEDEIAGVAAALGASYGGHLGVTTTSGPGLALKMETIGLAVMTELPLIVIDVQRAGPSTGLPTKTEQADLLQAVYGRNGESPLVVLAPQSPADCFDTALEAARIAIAYRTPVIVLSDGYVANGSEPWHIPDVSDIPPIEADFATEPNAHNASAQERHHPYQRDPETQIRAWALPGTPGLEHRIGGLEKSDSGMISHDPENHDRMVKLRRDKIDGIARDFADVVVDDPSGRANVLLLGWGSTYGPVRAAADAIRAAGHDVARAHLRHLNPFPTNLGDVLRAYDRVLVPEINLGQLTTMLRARYLVDVQAYSRVRGLPINSAELAADVITMIQELSA